MRLFENGKPLGQAHSAQKKIRKAGTGAYSHWHNKLHFSTFDNSDPRTNGRIYEIEAPRVVAPTLQWGTALLVLLTIGAIVFLAWGPEKIVNQLAIHQPSLLRNRNTIRSCGDWTVDFAKRASPVLPAFVGIAAFFIVVGPRVLYPSNPAFAG